MSASARYAVRTFAEWGLDRTGVRVLRYALGSTLAMTVAMAFNWQLAFIAPVLCVSVLAAPGPRPSFKAGVGFIAIIAVSCLAGLLLGRYLIAYPLVFIPFTGLLLLHLFYVKASGRAAFLIVWLLIALLVLPMITMMSPEISEMVAKGILLGALVTIGIVWLMHGLIPDPEAEEPKVEENGTAAAEAPAVPSRQEQYRTAAISTLAVLPVLVLFYSLQMMESLLILIFVALLSSQPGFATNLKMGAGLIIGNAIGGIAAILFYELLVMAPEFGFLILLTFLAALIFGAGAFSDKPTAKLYGMAFSTLLLVIGSVTAGGSDGAGAKVYTRVSQLFIAVVYVVLAVGVADRFLRRKGA